MTIEKDRLQETSTNMIDITPEALEQLREVLAQEGNPNLALRVFVEGNRAAMALDDTEHQDDVVTHFDGLRVLVDAQSAPYLIGATIGFANTLMERGFTIENANLPQSGGGGCCGGNCGCGK